jgi:hypothetical protein
MAALDYIDGVKITYEKYPNITQNDVRLHDVLNELTTYYNKTDAEKEQLKESGYDIGGLYDLIAIWEFKFKVICCKETTDQCCEGLQSDVKKLILSDEFKNRVAARVNLLESVKDDK